MPFVATAHATGILTPVLAKVKEAYSRMFVDAHQRCISKLKGVEYPLCLHLERTHARDQTKSKSKRATLHTRVIGAGARDFQLTSPEAIAQGELSISNHVNERRGCCYLRYVPM